MENQRIDKGPADLSEYNITIAANMIAKDQWVWRDAYPYDLVDGFEVNLIEPAFPRTEGETEQINEIVQELKLNKEVFINNQTETALAIKEAERIVYVRSKLGDILGGENI